MDRAFDGRLLPGEKLLWEGRPKPGLLFTSFDIFLVPFSLVWCGFAVLWTVMAGAEIAKIREAAPFLTFLPVVGLPFVGVGLYLLVGRFLLDALLRSRTRYAVTDQRVLMVREPPLGAVTALSLDRLPEVQLKEGLRGTGTIRTGRSAPPFGRGSFSMWSPTLDPTPQLIAISNARRVFDLIQRRSVRSG